MMILETPLIFQAIVMGILLGGIYGMISIGLTLIFGVMEVINVAHGAFLMLGAYMSYWTFLFLGVNPFISLPLSFLLSFIIGAGVYLLFIRRVIGAPPLMSLLLTYGLSVFILNSALLAWGPTYRGILWAPPPIVIGEVHVPTGRLGACIVALASSALLHIFLYKTHIGKSIRAVAQDRQAAALMGVDVDRIFITAFAIGIAIVGMAGSLITVGTEPSIQPYMGEWYTLRAFTIVVLGGLGSPTGALVGGFIIGLIETLIAYFIHPVLSPAISFIILVLTLLIRPSGILGEAQ